MTNIPAEVEFCSLRDFREKGYVVKWIEEWKDELIAFPHGDGFKVMSSVCPHFGGEIVFEPVRREVKCKWHDYRFCPDTARCLTYPIPGRLQEYALVVRPAGERGDVLVVKRP